MSLEERAILVTAVISLTPFSFRSLSENSAQSGK